jgi:hypothetical protein
MFSYGVRSFAKTGSGQQIRRRFVNSTMFVQHHVIDLPGNVTEAAQQVAGIVKGDRVVKLGSLKPGDSLAPNALLTSASGSAWLHNQVSICYFDGASFV